MRRTMLAALVVLAACGAQPEGEVAGGSQAGPDEPAIGVLAYGYAPGDTVEYRIELTQHLTADGTSTLTSAADDTADVTTVAAGIVRYDIAEGPEEGLLEVHISGDFESMETTGTFNGRPIDTPKDITTFAPEVEEPRRTVIIDRQGRPWRGDDGPSRLNPLWLLDPRFEAFDPLEDPLGPLFDGAALRVGDSWTVTDTTFVTDRQVTRTHRFTVEAVSETGDIATISYTSRRSAFTVDFGDVVQDLLVFLGRATDESAGLTIAAAPTDDRGVITFDLERGTVLNQQAASSYSFDVDAAIPLESFAAASIVLAGEITFTADRIDTRSG